MSAYKLSPSRHTTSPAGLHMAAAEAPCYLGRLPLDCLLKVLQSRAAPGEEQAALSPRDLAALLVAAPRGLFDAAVSEAAGARTVALLGAGASFNAPQRAAQLVLRLALAERVDCDVRSAGFSPAAAAATVRTTIVSKATGRVASYGDAAASLRQGVPHERIRACANTNNLSLVVCDPAVVYIFGWFHSNFVWHERSYPTAAQSPSVLKLTAPAAGPAPAPPLPAMPAVAAAPALAAAPPPQPAGAEDALPLEERVALHLRRVRHYIARRNAALLQL